MGAGQTELAAPALDDDVASTDGGLSPATKSRRVQKPRHRGTKAEEAREIEQLLQDIRARRLKADKAHENIDAKLADEARRLGDAGQSADIKHPPAERLPKFGNPISSLDDHRGTDSDSQAKLFVPILGMDNDNRHTDGHPGPGSGRQSSPMTEAARAATARSSPVANDGSCPQTVAVRKPAVPAGDQSGEGSSGPAAPSEPTTELQWPTRKYKEFEEAILGKKFALDTFLREVWAPFIKKHNLLVTKQVLEQVDPGIAEPLKGRIARHPSLLQEMGILTDKQVKKALANRPVSPVTIPIRIADPL